MSIKLRGYFKFYLPFRVLSTEAQSTQREKRKFFLIFQPLNHEMTEGYIGIYKLSPKLRDLCVLCVSVRGFFKLFFLELMTLEGL